MNLYWVSIRDKFEDWFIVAESATEAEEYHEFYEDYPRNSASAQLILRLSAKIVNDFDLKYTQHPPLELFGAIGANVTGITNLTININGKVLEERPYPEYRFCDIYDNLKCVYIINIVSSNMYKIGITKSIKNRLRHFKTGFPNEVRLDYFIQTEHYESLEKHLHSLFKHDRITGEWFEYNEEKTLALEANLYILKKEASDLFKVYFLKPYRSGSY